MSRAVWLSALLLLSSMGFAVPPPAGASSCSTPGCILWSVERAIDAQAWGSAVSVSPDGSRVFAGGQILTNGAAVTEALAAATGAPLWSSVSDWAKMPLASATSPDGALVAYSGRAFVTDVRSAATGVLARDHRPSAAHSDHALSVDFGPNSDDLYVGGVAGTGSAAQAVVHALRATGSPQLRWTSVTGGPLKDGVSDVRLSPDGTRLGVVGPADASQWSGKIRVAVHDAATGVLVWSALHPGYRDALSGHALAWAPDSSTVYATGGSVEGADEGRDGTHADWRVLALDAASGALRWSRTVDGTLRISDFPADLAVSPDGSRVYVTGTTGEASGTRYAVTTVAFAAATGVEAWRNVLSSTDPSADGLNVYVTPSGDRVIVGGFSSRNTPTPAAAVHVQALDSATGAQIWHTPHPIRIATRAAQPSMAMSDDGSRLFVTDSMDRSSDPSVSSMLVFAILVTPPPPPPVPNQPPRPVIAIGLPGACARTGAPIAFDGSGSHDPDGHVIGWKWDFGDGRSATGPSVTHAYAFPGTHTARLVVVDDDGESATASAPVCAAAAGVDVQPPSHAGSVGVAGRVSYPFRVVNTGTLTDTFALGLRGVTPGWTAELVDAATFAPIGSTTLAAGAWHDVELRVSPPRTAATGAGVANLRATSAFDPGAWDEGTTRTTISAARTGCGLLPGGLGC